MPSISPTAADLTRTSGFAGGYRAAIGGSGEQRVDLDYRLDDENAALIERMTRLRLALERLIAVNAEMRRELKRVRLENRRLQERLATHQPMN